MVATLLLSQASVGAPARASTQQTPRRSTISSPDVPGSVTPDTAGDTISEMRYHLIISQGAVGEVARSSAKYVTHAAADGGCRRLLP